MAVTAQPLAVSVEKLCRDSSFIKKREIFLPSIGSRPASRIDEPQSLLSSLEDIRGFRGIRATAIQDNHAFWKRVLTAYETEARREFAHHEDFQHNIRLSRIKSAPVKMTSSKEKEKDHGKLLPRRCNSGK